MTAHQSAAEAELASIPLPQDWEPTTVPSRSVDGGSEPCASHERIRLVASAEAAVVFASLGSQCLPAVCDSVIFDIAEGRAKYRLAYPPLATTITPVSSATVAPNQLVRLHFTCAGSAWDDDGRGAHDDTYVSLVEGVATFAWHHRVPTTADRLITAALIDQAVGIVAWQQSELRAGVAARRADNLEIALQNSRHIGAAIGIVMTLHKVTETQAFDLLRAVSQQSHRKLRDVADDVCHTGIVERQVASGSHSAQP